MFKTIRKLILFYFVFKKGVSLENNGEFKDSLYYFYLALSLNPDSIKTYKAVSRVSKKHNEHLNGIDFANKASARFPLNTDFYLIKADLYCCLKDYDNALRQCNMAISGNGADFRLYKKRAEVRVFQDEWKQAANDYISAVKLNQSDAELYADAAFSCFESGNYKQAEIYYKKALNLNNKKGHYYYMLGCTMLLLDKPDEAESSFQLAEAFGVPETAAI